MLIDMRTYRCRPGSIKKHLALYEKLGKPAQTKHLGNPLAYMQCESGNPNEYVHMWIYENAGDREQKRALMWADPDRINYTQESAKLGALESQTNQLMTPVDFFSLPKKLG